MAEGYINVKGPLYVGKKSVQISANMSYVNVTADNVTGYKFVAWIGVATVGWVGYVYPEDFSAKTVNVFATTTSSSARNIACFALYESLG